jgi:hypothetical protein
MERVAPARVKIERVRDNLLICCAAPKME